MDESERMLLRRRKTYITETVELNDQLLKDLLQFGLVNDEVVAMLHLEKTNQTKMCRLVEHLVATKNPDTFRLLCEALVKCYKWLVRDLRADLKVERGEVKPHPDTVQEAAALVHGRFGTSKRFSETDKKDMSELIAVRLQIAEDEWRAEIDKVAELLAEARRRLESRDTIAKTVDVELRAFVRRHEKQLVTHAHDMTTMREFVRRMLADDGTKNGAATADSEETDPRQLPEDFNPLVPVKDNVQRLLKQMSFALNQRESLFYEKEKCLKLLGINDAKVALDEAVSRATGLNFANADLEVEDKTETIRKLRRKIAELEQELETVCSGVDGIRRELDDRDREISKLRRLVHID